MWIPPLVPLFLALVLIPDPGVSQFGSQFKICNDCGKPDDPTKFKNAINKIVKKYNKCPHAEIIRFQLENGNICAKKDQPWVKELIACLDDGGKGSKCLVGSSSSSEKEFSKGTNEKPSTTTTNAPTTVPVTSTKTSTQSQDQNIGKFTQPGAATATASPAAPIDLNTTPLDSNKANVNLAQGKDKSLEPQNAGDQHSKMKHMQTAVISLILIVLVLVAVGVGVYCRMKKTNKLSTPCGSRPVEYTTAPSVDSIIEVNTG